MLRHNDLKAWRIFLDVIQVGSISAASELCQMEPSNISRTLTALEKSLGQKLFLRQNPIKLTTYGTRAVRLAQNIIDAHDQLVILGGTQNQTLQGPIRCGLPPSFFDRLLLRHYLDFNKKYPGIQIQTQDFRKPAPIEFYQKGNMLDLVIGYGPDPEMDRAFQYRLGECLRMPVASPAYLEKYGTPKKLSDLKNHILLDRDNALIYTGDYFVDTGEHDIVLRFAKKISFSSPTSLKEAALLGGGIHHGIPVIYCYKELERGELVALPGLWKFQPLDYYLFIRKESAELQRVQVFKQFLLDSLKEEFQLCGALCEKLGLK